MSSYLVNCIENITEKKYLELGVYNGLNFDHVFSKEKISVDTTHAATFQGTTDEFFSQLPSDEKFDVIYIDACHQYNYVIRDFNNSLKHLNKNGIIIVHDLIPDTLELTAQHYCGDGFKVLYHILKNQSSNYQMYSLDSDYGVTVFFNPSKPITEFKSHNVSYFEFKELLKFHKRYSREELQQIIRNITKFDKKSVGIKKKWKSRKKY